MNFSSLMSVASAITPLKTRRGNLTALLTSNSFLLDYLLAQLGKLLGLLFSSVIGPLMMQLQSLREVKGDWEN